MNRYVYCTLIFLLCMPYGRPLVVGSHTAFSRQSDVIFPAADGNNEARGFARFDEGFGLENKNTACLFSSVNQVSGPVRLNGGVLTLDQDFVVTSSFSLDWSGCIIGQHNRVDFSCGKNPIQIKQRTALSDPTIEFVTHASTNAAPISIDWNFDGNYIVSGELITTNEFEVFYFDGATLTQTNFLDRTGYVYTARWHPKNNHLAFSDVYGGTDELNIYNLNTSNGQLEAKDTRDFGSSIIFATAWHPSGEFLVAGGNPPTQEISLYSFSSTTGLLTDVSSVDLVPNRFVYLDTLSWSKQGDLLSVGTSSNSTVGATELLIYGFDGSSLTLTSSAETGRYVFSTDWSPTGTYVAVGLYTDQHNIRVYEYDAIGQSLTEVMSARQSETKRAYSVHWHPTGDFLLVGLGNGSASEVRVYSFNKLSKTLSLLLSIPVTNWVLTARWSPDGNYFAFGDYTRKVSIYSFTQSGSGAFVLKDVVLDMHRDIDVLGNLFLEGQCKVKGNGHHLKMLNGGRCGIRPGSRIIFEDIEIDPGLNGLYCLRNDSDIILRNAIVHVSHDYTFSQGALLFDEDVLLTGSQCFSYASNRTSTVNHQSLLFVDRDVTFKYAPLNNQSTLLHCDESGIIYFDGSSLVSTATGLHLNQGTVIFDDAVTLSSQGVNTGEAIVIDPDVHVKVLSHADVQLYGYFKYGQ